MKKWIARWLVVVMLLTGGALAESIPRAETGFDEKALARNIDYAPEEAGDFTIGNAKGAALQVLFEEKLPTYSTNGLMCFMLEVCGNANTRVAYPVLKILYSSSEALNAVSVSFALDGMRYDFAVSTTERASGRYKLEESRVYLNAEGCAFLRMLAAAQKADVCLTGDGQYAQTLERRAVYSTQRQELICESLAALDMPVGAPDFTDYPFEALTEAAFEAATGVKPRMEVSALDVPCEIPCGDVFGIIGYGAKGTSIYAMQKLLAEKGFYSGDTTAVVTESLRAAVRRAQTHYGLLATGYADAALINLLTGGEESAIAEPASAPRSYACASEHAAFTVNRWWSAKKVETTIPGGGKQIADADNALVIAEGEILGQSAEALSLSWDVEASVVYEGRWTFPASLYVETGEGTAFSSTLGVLARNRMIVAAEVPDYLLSTEGAWTLILSFGDLIFAFDLAR